MLLNEKQLHDLSGYRQPKKQAQWLSENGYSFDVRSDGRPNVLVNQLHERQCKGASRGAKTEPNFAALES